MPAEVFIDSNVWLYALIESAKPDPRAATARTLIAAQVRPVISTQVIREVSVNLLRKASVAAALDAGCTVLYSEDLQHGQVIQGQMTIVNPFRAA